MEDLYKQNSSIVYHFLYSICGDEVLAEDLMQETFLRAIESIHRYDGSCKISTWLCQIARHLLYQHWERTKREIHAPLDETLVAFDDTEQQVINRIELADVFSELKKLPWDMQRVVFYRVMSDLPYREIGAMLGKSENWARVTFYRAKTILLREVKRNEG